MQIFSLNYWNSVFLSDFSSKFLFASFFKRSLISAVWHLNGGRFCSLFKYSKPWIFDQILWWLWNCADSQMRVYLSSRSSIENRTLKWIEMRNGLTLSSFKKSSGECLVIFRTIPYIIILKWGYVWVGVFFFLIFLWLLHRWISSWNSVRGNSLLFQTWKSYHVLARI